MISNAKTVNDYIIEVPEKRMQAINKIRALCIKYLPNHGEDMSYRGTK